MAIEVLLMTDVKGLGAEGDVVVVADGYARNYLFPRQLAAPVTEATRRMLEKKRRERAERDARAREAAESLRAALEQASCTVTAKAGPEGKLFGSVTAADIAAALQEQGFAVDKNQIQLEQPIKELGVFTVPVRLHPQVEATVKVWVVEE